MDGFPKAKKIKEDVEDDDEAAQFERTEALKSHTTKEQSIKPQNSAKLEVPKATSVSESATKTNQSLPNEGSSPTSSLSDELLMIEQRQCSQLLEIKYPSPVTHVYNPLSYASQTHQNFVHRYGNNKKKVLFLGMNPGPFGMAQNGVPFGDTTMVKEFLGVSGVVSSPSNEHPKRAIQGLDCTKNEVSGTRFWNLMRELCSSPEAFFKNCYVHNYCPLCFMAASGKNITPPMLRTLERRHLEEICNQSLVEVMELLGVEFVVGVGKYAEERAKAALKSTLPSEGAYGYSGTDRQLSSACRNSSTSQNQTKTSTKQAVEEFLRLESLRKESSAISERYHGTATKSTLSTGSLVSSGGTDSSHIQDHSSSSTEVQTSNKQSPHLPPPNSRCHDNIKVYGLMHPSPINPAANKGWNKLATSKFSELGLLEIIKGSE